MNPVRLSTLAVVAAVALASTACGPRVVTDITLSPNLAKVTFAKRNFFAPETGVVECDRSTDGSLSNCRKMTVTFSKPGK
jgi:hypothetical protein